MKSLIDLRGIRAFEQLFHRFSRVGGCFLYGGTLARHVEFGTEGDPLIEMCNDIGAINIFLFPNCFAVDFPDPFSPIIMFRSSSNSMLSAFSMFS